MSYKWDVLVGRKILEIRDVGEGGFTLVFKDGSRAVFDVCGDCCSRTWIEHFEVPADIAGAVIVKCVHNTADWSNAEPTKTGNYEEQMSYYDTRIVTNRGDIVCEYRNSSNGYYGGWLEFSLHDEDLTNPARRDHGGKAG